MIFDLEDTYSFAMNNMDIIKENEFLVKYNKDTFYNKKLKLYHSSFINNYNDISIELDEEREEKGEEFKKVFMKFFNY